VLTRARLAHANFAGALFSPATDLSHSELMNVNLAGADLRSVNLRCAQLDGSKFEQADLRGTDLSKAQVAQVTFRGAQFTQTSLAGWVGLPSSLESCNLSGLVLPVGFDLRQTTLTGVKFTRATIQSAKFPATFKEPLPDFSGATLIDCEFMHQYERNPRALPSGQVLHGAIIRATSGSLKIPTDGSLSGCDLRGQRLCLSPYYPDSQAVSFEGADLTGAVFMSGDFTKCNFTGAKLDGITADSHDAGNLRLPPSFSIASK